MNKKRKGTRIVACPRLGKDVAIKTVVFVLPDGNDTRPGFVVCESSVECGCGVDSGTAISYDYEECPVRKMFL